MFDEKTQHVRAPHAEFLKKWDGLVDLEEAEQRSGTVEATAEGGDPEKARRFALPFLFIS